MKEHKIDIDRTKMSNGEIFELLFGLKLPYLKMCTRAECPEVCPFCYECKTWLEKKFDPKYLSKYILSEVIEYAIEDLKAEGIITLRKFELKEDTDLVFESEFPKLYNNHIPNEVIKLELDKE